MKKLTENMIRWAETKLGSTEYLQKSVNMNHDTYGEDGT